MGYFYLLNSKTITWILQLTKTICLGITFLILNPFFQSIIFFIHAYVVLLGWRSRINNAYYLRKLGFLVNSRELSDRQEWAVLGGILSKMCSLSHLLKNLKEIKEDFVLKWNFNHDRRFFEKYYVRTKGKIKRFVLIPTINALFPFQKSKNMYHQTLWQILLCRII